MKKVVLSFGVLLAAALFMAQEPLFIFHKASSGSSPVFSFVQEDFQFSCSAGTCIITVSSTTSGSILVCGLIGNNGQTDHITSCADSSGSGSWVLCPTTSCAVPGVGDLGTIDLAYNITGTGGALTVTVVNSSVGTDIPGGAFFGEWKCTANCGTLAEDQIANVEGSSSSCTSCTGAGFPSLTGTNDLCVQLINYDNSLSGSTGGYSISSGGLWLYNLTCTSGSAPSVTQTGAGAFQASGISFK